MDDVDEDDDEEEDDDDHNGDDVDHNDDDGVDHDENSAFSLSAAFKQNHFETFFEVAWLH